MLRSLPLIALVFAGCTPEGRDLSGLLDGGGADAGVAAHDAGFTPLDAGFAPDAAAPDAGPADGGAAPERVEVAHRRELRGVWVATVSNIDFPSRPGLGAAAQQAELRDIVALTRSAGLNAIFFQVRPECDALYASELEPWSRYLTGTQGGDPGYDPLAYLIEQAHAAGVEVHAWLNPYRAKANAGSTAVPPHLSLAAPEHAHRYGNFLWMDPGAEVVQDALLAVVRDVTARYDLDGVHFDDYFYPYPDGSPFPDDATFADYQAGGGALTRDDWRRDNVNRMVEAIHAAVKAEKPWVRFGISPFGIYRPGIPEGIVGLDQYAAIFADPPHWMAEGWVDYLAPQLYWPSTQTPQAYGTLVAWWAGLAYDGRFIAPGNFLSRLGDSASWSVDEFRTQIALTRAQGPDAAAGNIFFSLRPLAEDRDGIVGVFANELYPRPALPPQLPGAPGAPPAPPAPRLEQDGLHLEPGEPAAPKGWIVYAEVAGEWAVHGVYGPGGSVDRPAPGRYAVAAVDRYGRESLAAVIAVP